MGHRDLPRVERSVRSEKGAVASPTMTEQPNVVADASRPTPEAVVEMLDVVAEHSVDHALCDLELLVARLRAEAVEAERARQVLRATPVPVLRDALRLRAARFEAAR